MLFMAARDLDDPKERWCRSNVLVSHVCIGWRRLALAYTPLWDELFWTAGSRIEPALTVLKRSGDAPLSVHMDIMTCLHAPAATAKNVEAAHAAIGATLQHMRRLRSFTFFFSSDYYSPNAFQPFFSSTDPLPLPALRKLSVRYQALSESAAPLPSLNIACSDLQHLALLDVEMTGATYARVLGPSTHSVDLDRLSLPAGDLALILESAPNLDSLHLGSSKLLGNAPATFSAATVGKHLTILSVEHVREHTLQLLGQMLPIVDISHIFLSMEYSHKAMSPAWLDFLRISALGAVHELEFLAGEESEAMRLAGSIKTRVLVGKTSAFGLLPRTIFSGLRTIMVDITQWADLLDVVLGRMPALHKLQLTLDQSAIAKLEVPPREYGGDTGDFPVLGTVDIMLRGALPPTLKLARQLLRALHPIYFDAPNLDAVQYSGDPEHVDALAELFEDIVQKRHDNSSNFDVVEWAICGFE